MNLNRKQFEQLVADGVAAIPAKFRARLKNVAIVVEGEPTADQRQQMAMRDDEDLYGLYEGVPLTERGEHYSLVLPDKITIFMKAALEDSATEAEVRQIVRDTVWHEIAHHFGYSETEVEKREAERENEN